MIKATYVDHMRWSDIDTFMRFHIKAPTSVLINMDSTGLRRTNIEPKPGKEGIELFEPATWRGFTDCISIEDIHIKTTQLYDISLYEHLISEGVSEPQARGILPQNLMMEWYWSGSITDFANLYNKYHNSDVILEVRQVIWRIDEEMPDMYRSEWDSLIKN